MGRVQLVRDDCDPAEASPVLLCGLGYVVGSDGPVGLYVHEVATELRRFESENAPTNEIGNAQDCGR
jgi:hypothetical protein